MTKYTIEFNNFKGKNETTCNIYNLENNTDIEIILFKTSSKLCIEYKVVKTTIEGGLRNYNTISKGYIELSLTENQFKKPVKTLYIKKIVKALNDVIVEFFKKEEY